LIHFGMRGEINRRDAETQRKIFRLGGSAAKKLWTLNFGLWT